MFGLLLLISRPRYKVEKNIEIDLFIANDEQNMSAQSGKYSDIVGIQLVMGSVVQLDMLQISWTYLEPAELVLLQDIWDTGMGNFNPTSQNGLQSTNAKSVL